MIPKFRIWDKNLEELYDVEEIKYMYNNLVGKTDAFFYYYNKECFRSLLLDDCGNEVMQSTGMFDKNGKEIYEGDVVRLDYKIDDNFNIYEVKKFRAGTWMIENQFRSKELYFNTYCIEVVGNKYMMKYEEFLNEY